MDRRDNAEATGILTDDQLKKALEVIGLSYKGAVPEILYAQAIHCFEGLMDISRDTDAVRDFARRHELDIKYLVDGANFVISKMHFNPEENFYVTLGLPRNTTPEELRQRWKKLMLLYHPDKQIDDEEWVSERAKKVNEAYSTLKDDVKRSAYDRKLTEAPLNSRFPSPPEQQPAGTRHARPSRLFSQRRRSSFQEASSRDWFRKYLPKAMIGIYAFAAAVFLLYIYEQNRSSTLESELLAHKPLQPQLAAQEQEPAAAPPAGAAAPQAEKVIVPSVLPVERHSSLVETGRTGAEKAAASKDISKPASSDVMPAPQKEKKGTIFTSLFASSQARNVQEQKPEPEQSPIKQSSPEPQRPPVLQEALPPVIREAKAEQPHTPKTEGITKEEIDEFMQQYIKAYTHSDLEGFMALFSHSAVENNTMGYQDIRNAYRETFREKINDYRIQNMDIRTDGQKATVSGIYIVNRYISIEGRWVKHTGRITWRLARENSQLKIVSTNYDK